MTHYEKLALMIIRIVGFLCILKGFTGILITPFYFWLNGGAIHYQPFTFLISPNIEYLIFGMLISFSAKTLASNVCNALESNGE